MHDKQTRNQANALTFILQFSINMIVPIAICCVGGYYLDQYLGTSYLIIVGFFLGAISGMTSIWKLSKKMIQKDSYSSSYPVVKDQDTEDEDDSENDL